MSLVNVSISAPSSADLGQAFTVEGTVFEGPAPLGIIGLGPVAGATVTIYQNGTSKGTTTTKSVGFYSKSITINQAGTFGLRARALGVYSNIDYITITEPVPPPVGIPTTTTIAAPDKIAANERFFVSGILYDSNTGVPISNQPINAYYDGKSLGSATTGVDGDYLIETSIPESGFWTLKAEFPGTPGYAASSSLIDAIVTAAPIAMAIQILGPITLAIALFAYSRM